MCCNPPICKRRFQKAERVHPYFDTPDIRALNPPSQAALMGLTVYLGPPSMDTSPATEAKMANAFPHRVPKTFPLHYDTRMFSPDPHGLAQAIEELKAIPTVLDIIGERPWQEWPVRRLYRKHKAAFNDPICLLAVLETMLNAQRGTYIRPEYLLVPLGAEWMLYHWDNRVLGRMLSGIFIACKEDYGNNFDDTTSPIGKGRDSRGTYYVVDPKGGNEGIAWLLQARKKAISLGHALMAAEQSGAYGAWAGSEDLQNFNQPGDLYAVKWLDGCAVRKPEFVQANHDSEPFWRQKPARARMDRRDPLS